MSRRKQPNPKPLKRKAEDELEELSELLQLPRDALALQGLSEDEGAEDDYQIDVHARVALPAGRLFGPYAGYVTRQPQNALPTESKDAKLETVDEGGRKLWVILKDETGSWMKLLKSTSSPESANLSIYSDGVTIWCSVTSSLEPEAELRAMYRGERAKGALNGDMFLQVKTEPLVNGETNSLKDDQEKSPDCRDEEASTSSTSGLCVPTFPYGLQPGGLPLGSNVIYVPLLGHQQHQHQTSPRPSSVCSAASDQEKTTRGFCCAPCGITFSSQRTLQAHQGYYCSFRDTSKINSTSAQQQVDQSSDQDRVSDRTTPKSGAGSPARSASASGKRPAEEDNRPSEDGATSDGESSSAAGDGKAPRSGRLYRCPHCSYVTERKGGLTRHMRIHASPPVAEQADLSAVPRSLSRYCSNCDIQFSSYKTFQVHKAYYCSTRHAPRAAPVLLPSTSPQTTVAGDATDPPAAKVQKSIPDVKSGPDAKGGSGLVYGHPFYAAISTSPLILVPCSYLPGGGLAPTGGLISAGNIVMPNGTSEVSPISPVPAFTILPSPASKPEAAAIKVRSQTPKRDSSPGPAKPAIDGEELVDRPLDLSVRSRPSEETERPGEQITERPGSRISTTPPKIVTTPVMTSPGLCGGSACSLVSTEAVSPQILVKQGTSKCKECNIVFYKYENYLAHKRHYCASRPHKSSSRLGSSPEAPVQEVKERDVVSPENSVSPGHHPTASQSPKPSHCQSPSGGGQGLCQYFCVACGITFTSLDNLHAHQTYYCSKRETMLDVSKGLGFRCLKCKNSFTSEDVFKNHPCGLQRKCPYCDVFCPTLSAAQRHLVTHTGVKAFRCTICGYKGHTLRGMRTHIRIHLDASNGAPEENFIVCVGEDGVAVGSRKNSTSDSSVGSPVDATASEGKSRDNALVAISADVEGTSNSCDSSHCCQFCGYTSSYKGNVVRHIKLVHRDFLSPKSNRPVSAGGGGGGDKKPDYTWTVVKKENLSNDSDLSNDSRTIVKSEDVGSNHSSTPPPTEPPETILPDLKDENGSGKKNNSGKYCKSCDISFNHLSNFIAHKKYYCTPQSSDPLTPEPALV